MLINVLLGTFRSNRHKKAMIRVSILRKFYHLVDAGKVTKNSFAAAQLGVRLCFINFLLSGEEMVKVCETSFTSLQCMRHTVTFRVQLSEFWFVGAGAWNLYLALRNETQSVRSALG